MKTEIIKIDFSLPLEVQVSAPATIIRNGGLVAFPTETVYGLGGNALDADAAKKIYSAKGRPSDNPLIIHIAYPEDAEKYCITNESYYKIAKAFMPGPITVILPKKDIIPYSVT
ncbi:MAG: L-threonylcarbamoyladenylate synthase, partial [Eubacteriales bacterium]